MNIVNLPRYVFAGMASLVLHAAILFVADEKQAFAATAGNQSSSVAVNLVAVKPQPPAAKVEPQHPPVKKKPVVEEAKKPQPEPIQREKVHKPVKKEAIKPPVKAQPVKAKQTPTVATDKVETQAEQTEVQPAEVKQNVAEDPQPSSKPTPARSAQGASSLPVLVDRPSYLERPVPPKYPRLAQKRGIEGTAMIEIWLDEKGEQIKSVLIASSGAEMLDNAALKATKAWRFSPHVENGRRMPSRIRVPVRFSLD
ncbi:energy transducer TonB [Vibrio navarrensis]|uniref:energy transducer TonB n=1 Tax=Vibrio navarrensis TaxID=29495 RepID=UPI001D041952|nr:energy transducer TonB [Vibrio navarrensis]